MVHQSIDLEALKEIAQKRQPSKIKIKIEKTAFVARQDIQGLRIGVIRDSSFGFYYADDLKAFVDHGAELVFLNALEDTSLPQLDGLFIGGGFPETHLSALEANKSFRADILKAGQNGLPIYAECGGLMYLTRSIEWQGRKADMVGLIDGNTVMHKRPQGRGLVQLQERSDRLWHHSEEQGRSAENKESLNTIFKGHEFHYASLENLPKDSRYAFDVKRGYGITGTQDGLIIHNIQANFSHLRHTAQKPWVKEFLNFCCAR